MKRKKIRKEKLRMFGLIDTQNLYLCQLGCYSVERKGYPYYHKSSTPLNNFTFCRKKKHQGFSTVNHYYRDVFSKSDYHHWNETSYDLVDPIIIYESVPVISVRRYVRRKDLKKVLEQTYQSGKLQDVCFIQ